MSPQKRTALRAKLQRKLESLQYEKAKAAQHSGNAKTLQGEVIDLIDEIGLKSFSYDNDEGQNIKATKVQATKLIFDEPKLKKSLGASKWNKVTVRVLDTGLLEDAIATGFVDPVLVAEASEEQKNSPYIKLTVKKATNGDEEKIKPPTKKVLERKRGRLRGTES